MNNLVPPKQCPIGQYKSWHSPGYCIWREARGKGGGCLEGQLEGWAEEVLADERWAEQGWAEEPPGEEAIRPPKLITRSRCPVKPHAERGSAHLLGSSLQHPGLWSSWKADSIWAGWGEMY